MSFRCHRRALLLAFALASCAHANPTPPDAERVHAMATFPSAPGPAANAAPPELIDVRVLLVGLHGAKGERTQAEALERARMLIAMARGGERLSQLVPDYSDRAGAHEDLGVVRLKPQSPQSWDETFVQAALRLRTGEISDPVQQPDGYVVLERLKDPPVGPDRIGAKHILISYAGAPKALAGATRSEAEARTLAEQIAAEAHAEGADWNALAARYTEEPGSKATGGDLGKFGRGQMVAPFERAAFALKVGETSAVVQTPFGFHVIRRYE